MFPPCNAISEGRLPLCSTSLEAGALPSEVRIENDSDRKLSKSIFFQKFSGNHFYPRFMVRCSLLAENIFSVFRSPHSGPTHRYTILDSRLLPCNVHLTRCISRIRKIGRWLGQLVMRSRSPHSGPTHRYTILDSRLLPCNAISEGRLPLCNTSSEAGALPSDKQYMIDLL